MKVNSHDVGRVRVGVVKRLAALPRPADDAILHLAIWRTPLVEQVLSQVGGASRSLDELGEMRGYSGSPLYGNTISMSVVMVLRRARSSIGQESLDV